MLQILEIGPTVMFSVI